ncbi:hypothetical protein HD842_004509 [Massilia aurea]|uniref:Enoyl reductase (ER) domain-containing protein n=1 Tax=Massilia aurea TaxID=373040 RepID=A0A7X0CGH3_9BURK|nr:NADP-dependent oxidoreductase [Massilia aurea]MBB6136331.1 hypothetical protein [Massilia aurea]
MTATTNRRVVLVSHPKGKPTAENFRIEDAPIPTPGDGELLLETLFLSLDPYMRTRMNGTATYAAALELGDVMVGGTVARVEQSNHPDWKEGDVVVAYSGWQSFAISDGSNLRRVDPDSAPVSTAVGVLGMPGFTAYAGLLEIGQPKAGETVVVAAASGAVGSVVGQIARIKGARAVGIAGGPEKCAFVKDELKFDAVVDHRAPDFAEQLAKACPDGIDVYFENVGGQVLEAVKPLLNNFARIPVCGLMSHYNDAGAGASIDLSLTLFKSLTVRGFLQNEFVERLEPTFLKEAAGWIKDGSLRYREDIVEGLDKAPEAFIGLLDGKNFGKLVVRVAE